jgi:putative ABC transport system permease protein
MCALTIVLFGLLPAWRASQVDPQQSLNAASRGNTESRDGGRIRAVLVSTEVALGTLLTIGSRYGLPEFSLVVRSAGLLDGFSKALPESVSKVDADVPIAKIRTMSELIGKWSHQRRFNAGLLTAFALTAVLLAAIGVYGVVAYAVLERRKEIGVRIALGADSRHVTKLVLRNGMAPVLIGLGAGVVTAMLLAKVMASLLFKVSALDPITFISAPLVLALAGAVTCWLTARHAKRIDPAVCLRLE